MAREALMHMDGCHFFVWVSRDPDGQVVLTYHERRGSDLSIHGRYGHDGDDVCERCEALRHGSKPYSHSQTLAEWPDDAKGAFYAIMVATAEIEEAHKLGGAQ